MAAKVGEAPAPFNSEHQRYEERRKFDMITSG